MLGAVKAKQRGWGFFLRGKHPAARDYVTLGEEFRLAVGLSHWLERGFSELARPGADRVYRLWARGQEHGEIALGLIADSRDAVGRHHPLLVMGHGPLAGWEENWDLLTLALEGCWSGMAGLAGAQLSDFDALRAFFAELAPPRGDWQGVRRALAPADDPADDELPPTWSGVVPVLPGREEPETVTMPGPSDPQGTLALHVGRLSREAGLSRPSLAFLGGAPGSYRYWMYHRALRSSDFSTLWRP